MGLLRAGADGGGSRDFYSQGSNLRHVVEAGDQDAADVVVVEGAADREEKHVNKGASWEVDAYGWCGKDGYNCKRDHPSAAMCQAATSGWGSR